MSDFTARPEAGFLLVSLVLFLLAMFGISRLLNALIARMLGRGARRRAGDNDGRSVVVDGSNVLYWKEGVPDLQAVQGVLTALLRGNRRA